MLLMHEDYTRKYIYIYNSLNYCESKLIDEWNIMKYE